jgi:hypothetical protein
MIVCPIKLSWFGVSHLLVHVPIWVLRAAVIAAAHAGFGVGEAVRVFGNALLPFGETRLVDVEFGSLAQQCAKGDAGAGYAELADCDGLAGHVLYSGLDEINMMRLAQNVKRSAQKNAGRAWWRAG